MKKQKTVVVLNDFHSGNKWGLTPPEYQLPIIKHPESPEEMIQNMLTGLQKEMWYHFSAMATDCGPVDIIVLNGDMIDGPGHRGESFDTITTDSRKQCTMAYRAIKLFKPKEIYMTKGTPSHTGEVTDFENFIAEKCKVRAVEDRLFLKVNEVTFLFKHHSNNSSTPYGKHTPIAKTGIWNELRALRDREPRADVIVMAHTHCFMGIFDSYKIAMTAPALQAEGVKYARKLDGECNFGFLKFIVPPTGRRVWPIHYIVNLEAQKPKMYQAA